MGYGVLPDPTAIHYGGRQRTVRFHALLSRQRARTPPMINSLFLLLALLGIGQPLAAQERTVGVIRPGDVIRLAIWREEDMSGDFVVDESGIVVFPRVGEYSVLDDTPVSLRERLLADYRVYLRNPSIDMTVLRRIRIVGAVQNPGLHLVDPTVTVADALALSGGATPQGDPDKVRIVRDGREIAAGIRTDIQIADSPLRSGDQIYVPERSWISRNQGLVAATLSAGVSLVIALFIR